MAISAKDVKNLREKTGAGMMDCKKALGEVNGDFDEAVKLLRTQGLADAAKKSGRATTEGLIDSYIHAGGKIGVLIEVGCETDFVARNDEFKSFVHDMAMHVAATAPQYISREEVPQEEIDAEMNIYREQAKTEGKPENIIDKIAEGKCDKYLKKICLLEQPFIKDDKITIEQVIGEVVGKIGENVSVKRFARYELGNED